MGALQWLDKQLEGTALDRWARRKSDERRDEQKQTCDRARLLKTARDIELGKITAFPDIPDEFFDEDGSVIDPNTLLDSSGWFTSRRLLEIFAKFKCFSRAD